MSPPYGAARKVWLLGFVEERPDQEATHHAAYAGCLRFSTARLADAAEAEAPDFWEVGNGPDGRVELETSGSPKPPSPQLYFEERSNPGTVIAKEMLRLDRHRAKGRKMLRHLDPTDNRERRPPDRRRGRSIRAPA